MVNIEVEQALHTGNRLGEGPLWHPDEQALYWVDIESDTILRFDPATGHFEQFDVGVMVGSLAFRAGGGLVLATRNGFAFWDRETRRLVDLDDPEAHKPHARFNDGAVDRRGRFWAGTMGDGDNNNLYRLDPDLKITPMEAGIAVSNGIGWSLDNRAMYYTDSGAGTIYVYDFDLAMGEIANRRVFFRDADEPGLPDGLTVDSDGFIWSARWDGWRVLRLDPDGKVERRVPMPVQRPTSCIFGGANLDELYVTSAWTGLSDVEKAAQPMAGDLFRLRTDVHGLPEPYFGG